MGVRVCNTVQEASYSVTELLQLLDSDIDKLVFLNQTLIIVQTLSLGWGEEEYGSEQEQLIISVPSVSGQC